MSARHSFRVTHFIGRCLFCNGKWSQIVFRGLSVPWLFTGSNNLIYQYQLVILSVELDCPPKEKNVSPGLDKNSPSNLSINQKWNSAPWVNPQKLPTHLEGGEGKILLDYWKIGSKWVLDSKTQHVIPWFQYQQNPAPNFRTSKRCPPRFGGLDVGGRGWTTQKTGLSFPKLSK